MQSKGVVMMLRMMANSMPLEAHLENLKDAIKEYELIPNAENKNNIVHAATVTIMSIGDEGKATSTIIKEETERLQEEEMKNLFFPKKGSEE